MIAGRTNGCGVGRDSWCDRATLGFLSSPLHLAGLLVTVIRGTHISHLHLPSAFSLYISHWTGFEPLLVRFQAVLLVRRCTFLAILTGLCSVLTNNLSPTILCSTESFIRGVADSCRASSFSLGSCFCGPQFLKMSLNGRHAPLILVVFACFFVLHLGLWFLLSWINLDYFWKLFDFSPWMILQVQPAGQHAAVSYIKMFPLTWGHLSHKICFVCLALKIQICIILQHDYQIEVYFLCGCSHSVADFTRLRRCFFWLLGGIAWWADCGLWTVADNDGSWQLQQHSCHFDY